MRLLDGVGVGIDSELHSLLCYRAKYQDVRCCLQHEAARNDLGRHTKSLQSFLLIFGHMVFFLGEQGLGSLHRMEPTGVFMRFGFR